MSDVHCKFKRLGARLTYGVRTLGVLCGLRLIVGVWDFVSVCRWCADFVIFALFSGVY